MEFKEGFPQIKPEWRRMSRSYPGKAEGGGVEVGSGGSNVKQG